MPPVTISAAMTVADQFGFDDPFSGSVGWQARYGDAEVSQFRAADLVAEQWDISREEMEDYAAESHRRALRARAEGRFDAEIVPLGDALQDEGPREPDLDKIRSLPTLREGGRVTAALASQISDAAAAVLVCSETALDRHGLTPRARAHIMEYPWPGNVRELRNQLERIVLLHDDDVVDVDHFEVSNSLRPPDSDRFSVHLPEGGVSLADIEREVIERALDRFEGNVSQTARYLRISRQTLIYRMKKHDLRRTADDDD